MFVSHDTPSIFLLLILLFLNVLLLHAELSYSYLFAILTMRSALSLRKRVVVAGKVTV